MKNYLKNKESMDELLKLMVDYNVFTYGVTATGEKGYDYSHKFRNYFLECIKKAESINFKGSEKELFISTLMTFNNISFGLAEQMSNVIGGRNILADKIQSQGKCIT